MTGKLLVWTLMGLLVLQASAFIVQTEAPCTYRAKKCTELNMVFDFFKQKSKEGLEQLNNLAESNYKGQLGKGLADVAAYTQASNAAFAKGLAKSRVRLQEGLETLFTGMSPEEALEELEDILLQSDLGVDVAEEVVQEVRDLREDSTTMLSRDDLRSILRGKLIEALDTGKPGTVQFSTSEKMPTVLFIMGANGMGVSRLSTFGHSNFMSSIAFNIADSFIYYRSTYKGF
jgi:signal recognition particle GTPase